MVGFTGIKVWVNEGVQVKQHLIPWEEVREDYRPGGDKFNEGTVTVNGVQFFKTNGTLVWFPRENITRVEATIDA